LTLLRRLVATDLYVLNVGAGSCTVAVPPSGNLTMVDVNDGSDQRSYEPSRSEAPLTDPIDWFTEKFGTDLFRLILSHPERITWRDCGGSCSTSRC